MLYSFCSFHEIHTTELTTIICFPYNYLFLQFNRTPLHQAAARGHKDVIEVLIRHGASVDVVDEVIFIID